MKISLFRYLVLLAALVINFCTGKAIDKGDSFLSKKDFSLIPSSGISLFSIENSSGDITIKGWEKDSIKIETTVNFETSNKKTASEVEEQLTFIQGNNNRTLFVSWKVNPDYQFNIPVSVSYVVSLPENMTVKSTGQQGHLILENLKGTLQVSHKLGSVSINHLESNTESSIDLKSCNAKLLNLNRLNLNADNCQVQLQNCTELNATTGYSTLALKNIQKLNCQSNFNKLSIENIENIELHGSNCNADIQSLTKYGLIEINKGSLTIKKISPLVNELNIANQKAPVELYVKEDMPFFINGQNEQGGFIYPWPDKIRVINDLSTTSFSGQNGQVSSLSAKFIIFNQLAVIQIKKE